MGETVTIGSTRMRVGFYRYAKEQIQIKQEKKEQNEWKKEKEKKKKENEQDNTRVLRSKNK